jgi:hypothetical protein
MLPMSGTFSVPLRRPLSCPPPRSTGEIFTPLRTYKMPTPLGPMIFCPSSVIRSTPSFSTLSSTHSGACDASTCRYGSGGKFSPEASVGLGLAARSARAEAKTFRACLITFAISFMSWIVPTSLLMNWIDTRAVSSLIVSPSIFGETNPNSSTGNAIALRPSGSMSANTSSTDGCSIAEVIADTSPRSRRMGRRVPRRPRLFPSVPPLVKIISSGCAPSVAATRARADSSSLFASAPSA